MGRSTCASKEICLSEMIDDVRWRLRCVYGNRSVLIKILRQFGVRMALGLQQISYDVTKYE